MNQLLYQYNPWWEQTWSPENTHSRPRYQTALTQNYTNNKIILLTGLRRVGKSTIMRLAIKDLIDSGVQPIDILYVSLDDYLLSDKSILQVIDEFRDLHHHPKSHKLYLFLDEVAHKQDFQIQLKNMHDMGNVVLVAAASSSSMLRDDKALLTGRTIIQQVQPLDLNEYLAFKGVTLKQRDKGLLRGYFEEYMQCGGLPENVLNPSREYLMGLVDDIIQKDITAYHGLRNHQLLRDYFRLLMERSGKQLSVNKIAKILQISPDTSSRYLTYFESTYLVRLVPRWCKTNQRLISPKKVYVCDLGILHLFLGDRDYGAYFETYLSMLLSRQGPLFYVKEEEIEIDFLTENKILVESKYYGSMSPAQQKLFDSFKADQKILVDSVENAEQLDNIKA